MHRPTDAARLGRGAMGEGCFRLLFGVTYYVSLNANFFERYIIYRLSVILYFYSIIFIKLIDYILIFTLHFYFLYCK